MCRPPRLSPAASAASRNGAGSVASRGDGVSFAASDGTRSDAEESSSEASYAATGSQDRQQLFLNDHQSQRRGYHLRRTYVVCCSCCLSHPGSHA